jgi:phage anti-repressor protein
VRLWQKCSDEQKQAAVEHDLCMTGTIKALGYPCRDTFAAWIDESTPKCGFTLSAKWVVCSTHQSYSGRQSLSDQKLPEG